MSTIAMDGLVSTQHLPIPSGKLRIKNLFRTGLRFYLTWTPIKKGRYPIMLYGHRLLAEKSMVECHTRDRGRMLVSLWDEMQYPIYYNNFEMQYAFILRSLLRGTRNLLDVGGNIGQYALLFARYAERVFTFEPMPMKIAHLSHNIALNGLQGRVKLVTKALTDFNGNSTFELPNESGNEGTGSLVCNAACNLQRINVECTTLDTFCEMESVGLNEIDLIKMDIEGSELSALKGMMNVLSSDSKPILILELNKPMMALAGYEATDVQNYLKGFGYEGYGMTKRGLVWLETINPHVENYCFLTPEHLTMEKVRRVLRH